MSHRLLESHCKAAENFCVTSPKLHWIQTGKYIVTDRPDRLGLSLSKQAGNPGRAQEAIQFSCFSNPNSSSKEAASSWPVIKTRVAIGD